MNPNQTRDEFQPSTGSSQQMYQAELVQDEPPPRPRPFAVWFFVVFMISLVVGPLVYFGLPAEIARWHQAAIIEQWLDGDLAGAIQSLDHLIERYPDQAGLLLQRAEWNLQLENFAAALSDSDRALELDPASYTAYQLRSQARQHLGDFEAGVEDMEKVLAISKQGRPGLRPSALNGLAYARALAKSDLDQALDEIQEALKLSQASADPGWEPALLDTRGFIHYQRQDYEAARADLDRCVELIEELYTQVAEKLQGDHPRVMDLRIGQRELKRMEKSVAVLHYHRALLYEALEMPTEAEQNLARVRELGYEPNPGLF